MSMQLLLGNEAIGLGAIKAGVKVVTGYPGTPSTEVLETIAKHNPGDIYVEWSVNEKTALEVGAGASYSGARVLVTMKQVGLNVASDPLMSLAYIGVKGGMVVLVADDPGPISSQTEQDTRLFAKYAHLPVFDPTTPEEAYLMIEEAFNFSEKYQTPVLFRPTTRVCHACASVEVQDTKHTYNAEGFVKDAKWTIFPKLSYQNHLKIVENEKQIAGAFAMYPRNSVTRKGTKGIIASGVSYTYVKEIIDENSLEVPLLKLVTPHPFPNTLVLNFLQDLDEVLVVEELEPVIEQSVMQLCGVYRHTIKIRGKESKALPYTGEYSYENIKKAVFNLLQIKYEESEEDKMPLLPIRPPVLCAGCPHRASFYSVKKAMEKLKQKSIFTGDIGCYTLGNAKPLDMVDTCLCMGAGITIAQGLNRAEKDTKQIAFIGDSTFFHTGIPGVINAVYNETDITVIILDNSTTAMTGHQPHPGTGQTMMGSISQKISIEKVLEGIGVKFIKKANPFELENAMAVVSEAVSFKGVSVVIFEAPCIALVKEAEAMTVLDQCSGCKRCIKEIGCPALSMKNGKAFIDKALCYGCKLCVKVCKSDAIGGRA